MLGRRKWIAAAAVATSLMAVGPAAVGAEAPAAAQDAMTQLSLQTEGAVVEYGGQQYRFGLDGSMALEQAELPGSFRSNVESLRMAGQNEHLGQIKVEIDEQGMEPTSTFQPGLTGGKHTIELPLRITISRPPADGDKSAREPLVLAAKEPGQLVGQIGSFPPNGELYKLQNPIDLVLPDNPDEVVASLDKFPVKVGGL